MAALDLDDNGVPTSAQNINPAAPSPAALEWAQYNVVADGGDVSQGAKADAAVTDPTASGTIVALLKGLLTNLRKNATGLMKAEDEAHVSGDVGVLALAVRRDTAAVGSGADGDNSTLNVDANGRLYVSTEADAVAQLSNASSSSLGQTLTVKSTAGQLFGFTGFIDAAGTDAFIQVFDNASGATTGAPKIVFPIVAGKAFSLNLAAGNRGRDFANGIVIAYSSTVATYTSVSSHMWVDAQYE